MIEMMILAMIASVVVKRGAEDLIHSARGGTPPRYAAASARRKSGAAGRYWSEVWDDVWTEKSRRHAAKQAGRTSSPSSTSRPRGAATRFVAGLMQDGTRKVRRSWQDGWTRADEKRREKATRPRPGQVTVPGTVVPNAPSRPEDEDRPEDRPRPDPHVVLDEDDSPVPVPQDETTDPTGQDDQSVPDYPPDSGPDNQTSTPLASTTTQEGTPTMTTTMPTGTEVVSLNKAIEYSESTARVAKEMVNSIDFTVASLATGGVTGVAVAEFTSAKEAFGSIDVAMSRAAAEFHKQLAIQEAFIANPGAGSKEFIMGSR